MPDKFEFITLDEPISITDNVYYMLIDGGCIIPEDLLKNQKDIDTVRNAIETIKKFISQAEDAGVIDTDC